MYLNIPCLRHLSYNVNFIFAFFSEPLPVTNLQFSQISTASMRLSWDVSSDSSQDDFIVARRRSDSDVETTAEVDASCGNSCSLMLNDLSPGYLYVVTVHAVSGTTEGEREERSQQTSK